MKMENNALVIIAILGAVVSPIITGLGLLLQYRKDIKRAADDKIKLSAEADKITAEAHAIDTKTDIDSLNFYIGLVNALRLEVNNLTELNRKTGGEIAILSAKLMQSDAENAQLTRRNAELTKEVQELREEVALLRKQQKGE